MHPEKEYLDYLAKGQFMIQEETRSGTCIFPPRMAEPGTGLTTLAWRKASGIGTVYSSTTIHPRAPAKPYNLALIDLAEGPRMMCRVDGITPADVFIGLKVVAKIVAEDGGAVLVFEPLPASEGQP
ncbi:MAG: OB-fold domain-containing protein [Luteibacter sp.]